MYFPPFSRQVNRSSESPISGRGHTADPPEIWDQTSGSLGHAAGDCRPPECPGSETHLETAFVLLGRKGGSEQPGRAEQRGPGRALPGPGECQRLLQELDQSRAAQEHRGRCRGSQAGAQLSPQDASLAPEGASHTRWMDPGIGWSSQGPSFLPEPQVIEAERTL